jgi:hypothetical protein
MMNVKVDRRRVRHPIVGIAQAHQRIRESRGPASAYQCIGVCNGQARDWAYQHNDPDELWSKHYPARPYSLDPARYAPMCRSCHKAYDYRVGRHGR